MWTILCGLLLCCAPCATAEYVQLAKPLEVGIGQRSALLFDRSEPPIPAPRVRLERRQEDGSISATPSSIPAPTTAGQDSSSIIGLQTATGTARDDLPSPFDTSLGNNFTAPSCPAFFQTFLSNSTFQDCLPFSLLLQTSNAFFTATRSRVALTRTLDATCAVPDLSACVAAMTALADQIQQPEHCGADYEMQNPMVRQAYNGFVSYLPLYHAGCLTDDASGEYCYTSAVNNASTPSAAYVYYLPLGVGLPEGSAARAGCGTCLRDTMSVFAVYADDKEQPLSETYGAAAEQLAGQCGQPFSEAVRQSSSSNGAGQVGVAGLAFAVTLSAVLLQLVL